MTEEEKGTEDQTEASGDAQDQAAGETKSTRERMGDGIKEGIGVLSAFKDALEETIQEARDRGDLSAEKAKEVVKEVLEKAQSAGERARDRLDFVPQADIEAVRGAVDAIRDRVSRLEESVFGSAQKSEKPKDSASDDADAED